MHGLINRSVQCFVRDIYGPELWDRVTEVLDLGFDNFETMLSYEDQITYDLVDVLAGQLGKPSEDLLEDLGTYLVSHPNVQSLRRLLRFGGVSFEDFLHSLDDLPDRARLAVSDLELPQLELRAHAQGVFSLHCTSPHPGFGHVVLGVMRAMADDYGALVFMEHQGGQTGTEVLSINLLEIEFNEGNSFDLAETPVAAAGAA